MLTVANKTPLVSRGNRVASVQGIPLRHPSMVPSSFPQLWELLVRSIPTLVGLLTLFAALPAIAADSPDDVVATLQSSYVERNFVAYDALLSDEFTFAFAPDDVASGLPSVYDRAQDLLVTQRMFTGQPGQTPGGDPIPPISGFQLVLTPVGNWTTSVPAELAGTQKRGYDAELVVSFTDGSVARVGGIQEFYVEEVSAGVYQLRFWQDFGVPKMPLDDISWGALKAGAFSPVATQTESMTQVKRRYSPM